MTSQEVAPEIEDALRKLGMKPIKLSRFELWRHAVWMKVHHLLLGCSRIPEMIYDPNSARLVQVGTVCAVCHRPFPYGR